MNETTSPTPSCMQIVEARGRQRGTIIEGQLRLDGEMECPDGCARHDIEGAPVAQFSAVQRPGNPLDREGARRNGLVAGSLHAGQVDREMTRKPSGHACAAVAGQANCDDGGDASARPHRGRIAPASHVLVSRLECLS
jgi:hypothetical protein